MKLHRELTLQNVKPSAAKAADDLRELAEYLERSLQLETDAEITDCLGTNWRGLNSNLTQALRVSKWAAEVLDRFAGEGEGQTEARKTLLYGEVERLVEIRQIARALPSKWRHARSELDPPKTREHATRLESLADKFQTLGLDEGLPFSRNRQTGRSYRRKTLSHSRSGCRRNPWTGFSFAGARFVSPECGSNPG